MSLKLVQKRKQPLDPPPFATSFLFFETLNFLRDPLLGTPGTLGQRQTLLDVQINYLLILSTTHVEKT